LNSQLFEGRSLIAGAASGDVLYAEIGLSFWGGIDAETGIIIDRHHPLCGICIAGRMLAIPSGRGSCTGSAVLIELIMRDLAPAALIFCEREVILPLGALMAEAMFGRSLPMLRLDPKAFAALKDCRRAEIRDGCLVVQSDVPLPPAPALKAPVVSNIRLSSQDEAMLRGDEGPARKLAMGVVLAMARLQDADELIDIAQAHLDCCIHTGPASVAIPERLRELGGRLKIPATLNAISIDRQRWVPLGFDPGLAQQVERQTEAYLAMGAVPSFTCAPYLLKGAPVAGEQISWGESNAVAFANSVLGAKTEKYPDYLDLCVALTGRAPNTGCHIAAHRKARVHIDVALPDNADDSFFPLLGYLAGSLAPYAIPVVTGLERAIMTRDDLKAFSAAFATTSAAPMFHIVNITPEAPDLASAIASDGVLAEPLRIGPSELRAAWLDLAGADKSDVSCIAIGNPHASADEMIHLAALCVGRQKSPSVAAMITTGRALYDEARAAGAIDELERFGFQFVTDACWCMLTPSVIPGGPGTVLTNSGKYAHYGPGLINGRVRYAGLAACVDAAETGWYDGMLPDWLDHGQISSKIMVAGEGFEPPTPGL
jgi:cis-L-3-hydroxyproline dehydratase